MARIAEEKTINKVRFFFEGNEDDVVAFMRAATFEYLLSNLAQSDDEMHKESAARQIRGRNLRGLMYLLAFVEMTLCPAVYTAYVVYMDDMGSVVWFGMIAVAVMVFGMIIVYQKGKYQEQQNLEGHGQSLVMLHAHVTVE